MKFAKYFFLFNLVFLAYTHKAFSNVVVSDLGLKTMVKEGTLIISYQGKLLDYPEMIVKDNRVEVVIPQADIKKTIEKMVSFATMGNDTRIRAVKTGRNSALITTELPFSVKAQQDKISMKLSEGKIELSIPKLKATSTVAAFQKKLDVTPAPKKLDKNYLDALLALENKKAETEKVPEKKPRLVLEDTKGDISIEGEEAKADTVKTSQSAPETTATTTANNEFSVTNYVGKFALFLGAIIAFFYGILVLMKKGVIKKSKLGFLNNTDNVVVLSNTFVAPKKSLMLVKAHKQVFLVSNTESGMQLISEVKDAAGLFKEGEKTIAGTNFDVTLDETDDISISQIKLKEDITKSTPEKLPKAYAEAKERVKFSDQLKKKVKNLKPLQ